jgi:hypothetical protein
MMSDDQPVVCVVDDDAEVRRALERPVTIDRLCRLGFPLGEGLHRVRTGPTPRLPGARRSDAGAFGP